MHQRLLLDAARGIEYTAHESATLIALIDCVMPRAGAY